MRHPQSPAVTALPKHAASRGFGLVELMVALTIGLVMIAAMVALFVGTSRNNREMATTTSMIENGRFAVQLLEGDIVHAGFWGTFVPDFDNATFTDVPGDVPVDVPDPCLAYDTANWTSAYRNGLLGIPVQAYDDVQVGDDPLCEDVVGDVDGIPGPDILPNTDMLVVRHVATCTAGMGDCEGLVAGKLYLQASLCTEDVVPYRLDRYAPSPPVVFDLRRMACAATPVADVRRFVSNIYYVRNYADTPGDGIPTLMRSTFDQYGGTLSHQYAGDLSTANDPVELIEGIDGFRVEFGVDDLSGTGAAVDYTAATEWLDDETKLMAVNRGDGIPDGPFVHCSDTTPCTVADLINTTAVRIYVLARSREPTQGYTDTKEYSLGAGTTLPPFNDGFKRHVYSTTVRLPNVSGRRERP
jgi:type IV pilus assembly protein PilW